MLRRMLWIGTVALVCLAALGSGCVPKVEAPSAPKWPTKDITLIVPYKPGGGYDLTARATAPFIEKYLPSKVHVVVQNIEGAGGKIGTMELVKAAPDGHTIGVLDPADLAVMQLMGQLETDIGAITWLFRLDRLADMMVVRSGGSFTTPDAFRGKDVRMAAVGPGVTFRSAVLAKALGAVPHFVSYDGTGEAAMAIMRGDIDASVINWASQMKQVRASEGKLVPLLVSEPTTQVAEVPSARQLGVTVDEGAMGYSHILAAPPNLPEELQKAWSDVFAKVAQDSEWKAQMEKAGYPPAPLAGADLGAAVRSTLEACERNKEMLQYVK